MVNVRCCSNRCKLSTHVKDVSSVCVARSQGSACGKGVKVDVASSKSSFLLL